MFFSEWPALWISFKVALASSLLILAPGTAAGWFLARKQFLAKPLLEALIHMPLVLPPVVTGYFLLLLLGRQSWLVHLLEVWFGVHLAFTWSGAVLAASIMSFPLLVRSVRLAVELIDQRLEIAAATLGSSPYRVFFRITLPLAAPGLLTGFTLAFVRGLGEFGATITFAGNIEGETRTLPMAVYTYMQTPGKETEVLFLALMSMTLSLAALIFSEHQAKKLSN